ncbi:MAG: GFA family protein [Gammaproteobacteria bacterium]|nr:GFA family protein [Gammaproteobacteria bacterium]NVK86858.1 GFA family protein [Gammaproteobacteria bacterium]
MEYFGQCHCQAVQFSFNSELINSALQCNCSICRRKNLIMSLTRIASEHFTILAGKDNLALYLWGDHDVNHYFCKTCGVSPFSDINCEPFGYRINLGCVDSLDLTQLSITHFDGRNEL